TKGPVDLRDYTQWWRYLPGAQWRRPHGPRSTTRGLGKHPVTQVAAEDAEAYAAWAGKELPTEAEWEFAARGGLDGAVFTWGDDLAPGGRMMAIPGQGEFPGRTSRPTAGRGHPRSRASRPTVTGCTTWPATSGNGPATTSSPAGAGRFSTPAARRATRASRQRRQAWRQVSPARTSRAA